jgi:EmrB/QacA subfamily drug resistance transporter
MSARMRYLVLFVASLASFTAAFMSSAINIALPAIGREFGAGAVAMGWVTTSYLLAAAVGLLPIGRLADLYGRHRTFRTGIVVYTAASVLCAVAPTTATLIAFRIVQGLGGAMIFSTSTALVAMAFPRTERGRALGWNTAAVYTGLSLGPFIGGVLTHRLGWRSLFLVNIPIGLLLLAVSLWKMRDTSNERKVVRFDVVGALIYAVGIVALIVGFSGLPATSNLGLTLVGVVVLVGFGFWELRSRDPLVDLRIFATNRTFALSNLAALTNYAATAAVGFLLSLYLQYNRALTPEAAGAVLVAQPVLQTVFSPLAGRLSDRIQPRLVASFGMAMTVVGLLWFMRLQPATPIALIVATLAWLGVSFGLFSSPNTNAIMSAVPAELYGVASGTLATMRSVGQMMSMGIAMVMLSAYLGTAQITPSTAPKLLAGTHVGLAVFAGLCFIGLLASMARGNLGDRSLPHL